MTIVLDAKQVEIRPKVGKEFQIDGDWYRVEYVQEMLTDPGGWLVRLKEINAGEI